MVLGSLLLHRDSAARRLWRGDDEPQRAFVGFPMRTALLIPPPVACSVWWYSFQYGVAVPTPDGWGHISEEDGVMCGRIALAGWALVLLAMWWDGYVAFKLGLNSRQAASTASASDMDADADADATGVGKESQSVECQKLKVRSKKAQ